MIKRQQTLIIKRAWIDQQTAVVLHHIGKKKGFSKTLQQ
jgi:hypothetical protein